MRHKWDITTYDDYDVCTVCGLKRSNKIVIKGWNMNAYGFKQYLVNGVWVKEIPDCIPKNKSNESNNHGLPNEPIIRGNQPDSTGI